MSVTIPESLLRSLDQMVADRGFENRFQAVAELIHDRVAEHQQATGNEIMAGSITLFYDQSKNNLLAQLAELQRGHVAEVISLLHVQLERNFMMEVILVQGPAQKLKRITNALVACKGVKAGKLTLTPTVLPPLLTQTISGGGYWSMVLPRHTALRQTDPNGGVNVAVLL